MASIYGIKGTQIFRNGGRNDLGLDKSLFNPEPQKDPHLQLYEDPDYSTMSKGDLKKLLAQGKIKSIYKPWV